jgi:hypothetical protein
VATSTTRGRGRRIRNPHTKKPWPAVRTAAVVVHGREAVSRRDGGYRKGVREGGGQGKKDQGMVSEVE